MTGGYSIKEVISMIEIIMKNGNIATWEKTEYTDYTYDGKCFIVINKDKWVGIYNMDCVRNIVVND